MKIYEKLELEVLELDATDIILTSGGDGLNNKGDLDEENGDYSDAGGELYSYWN